MKLFNWIGGENTDYNLIVSQFPILQNPTVSITFPTTGDYYDPPGSSDPDIIYLAGTASAENEIVVVTWSNDRVGFSGTASGTTYWSIPDLPLVCGNDNIITITAEDNQGNVGSYILIINVSLIFLYIVFNVSEHLRQKLGEI